MKQRISITLDEKTLELVEEALTQNQSQFRNRSHAIEFIVKKFLELGNKDGGKEK